MWQQSTVTYLFYSSNVYFVIIKYAEILGNHFSYSPGNELLNVLDTLKFHLAIKKKMPRLNSYWQYVLLLNIKPIDNKEVENTYFYTAVLHSTLDKELT